MDAPLLGADVHAVHANFLSALRDQRDIIMTFYEAELNSNRAQLQLLLSQMAEISQMGDANTRSESSIVRASTDLYRRLQQLRNYAILNYTGLVKLA